MQDKIKLFRITTHDISLEGLLKGQLKYLNQYFDVTGIAADTGVLEKVKEREGVRVISIPMKREISLKDDWKCLWQLFRLFRKEKPQIIHANTPKGSLLSMIAGKLARVPIRIYTVTGLRYQGTQGKLQWVLKTMERITCLCATTVIPEGQGVKQALIQDHITQKPLEVILNGNINGVDTEYFCPTHFKNQKLTIRQSLNLTADDFVFIFIGRLIKDKGMNELAEVMKKIQHRCKLILIGRFENNLNPMTSENEFFFRKSKAVRYIGCQEDVRPYLAAADALVFPSYREGFPNVVLEACSMSLPAIVTNISGCNEIITQGENGVIISPRSINELEQAMKTFIEQPEKLAQMRENTRERIIERYKRENVWEALKERYIDILTNKKD